MYEFGRQVSRLSKQECDCLSPAATVTICYAYAVIVSIPTSPHKVVCPTDSRPGCVRPEPLVVSVFRSKVIKLAGKAFSLIKLFSYSSAVLNLE